mmetsp:Transcript_59887/g.151688  ORF Transcript_59887/g.151688 Transcript_59887/m.151688 type:complete len:97 (-) Transcript_59887:136-426(-)
MLGPKAIMLPTMHSLIQKRSSSPCEASLHFSHLADNEPTRRREGPSGELISSCCTSCSILGVVWRCLIRGQQRSPCRMAEGRPNLTLLMYSLASWI